MEERKRGKGEEGTRCCMVMEDQEEKKGRLAKGCLLNFSDLFHFLFFIISLQFFMESIWEAKFNWKITKLY